MYKLLSIFLLSLFFVTGCNTGPAQYEITGICSTERLNSFDMRVDQAALIVDAEELSNGQTYIPVLLDHKMDTGHLIGRVTRLVVSEDHTSFVATIVASRAIIGRIQRKELVGVSIGFRPLEVKGRWILRLDLAEISLVPVGADPGAVILSIKRIEEP